MRIRSSHFAALLLLSLMVFSAQVFSRPINIVMNPWPQEGYFSCQSYTSALAASFNAASPFQAKTQAQLRDLELRIRKEIEKNAIKNGRKYNEADHDDWRTGIEKAFNGEMKLKTKEFKKWTEAIEYIATRTNMRAAAALPKQFAVALVDMPVLMSFERIEKSDYRGAKKNSSHIVTIFGLQEPNSSTTEDFKPELLILNPAVKDGGTLVCSDHPITTGDRNYSAVTSLTKDYDVKVFGKDKNRRYLVHTIERK
jgi:hypothetical protein